MNWLREKDLNLRPLGYEPIFGITQDNSGLPPVLRINSLPISSIRWSRAELKLNGHTLGTPTSESRPQLRLRAHRRRAGHRAAPRVALEAHPLVSRAGRDALFEWGQCESAHGPGRRSCMRNLTVVAR